MTAIPDATVRDAQAVIRSTSGERSVPLDAFFVDYFETVVQEGEMLTSVTLPPLPANARTCYIKFLPRTEDDYATVAVAARLQLDPSNRVEEVRVALEESPERATLVGHIPEAKRRYSVSGSSTTSRDLGWL